MHFLQFAAPTITSGQKARLTASDPFSDDLFSPSTLAEVTKEFEGAAATTSHLDLSKAVSRGLFSSNWKRKRDDSSNRSGSSDKGSSSSAGSSAKSSASSLFDPPSKSAKGSGGRGRGRGRGSYRNQSQGSSGNSSKEKNFQK